MRGGGKVGIVPAVDDDGEEVEVGVIGMTKEKRVDARGVVAEAKEALVRSPLVRWYRPCRWWR